MKDKLNISFKELRRISEKTLAFIKDFSGEEKIDSKTCIERDLGFSGLDADELLLAIHQEFNVDFEHFHFKTYFHEEGVDLIYYPLLPIQLIIFPFQLLIAAVNKIFISPSLNKLVYFNLFTEVERLRGFEKLELTVGDLITSVLLKEFKLRKEVDIQLKPV